MVEFLQAYGIWIFFGLLFLFMMLSHGRGGSGCGMGGHQHRPHEQGGKPEEDESSEGDRRGHGCH